MCKVHESTIDKIYKVSQKMLKQVPKASNKDTYYTQEHCNENVKK